MIEIYKQVNDNEEFVCIKSTGPQQCIRITKTIGEYFDEDSITYQWRLDMWTSNGWNEFVKEVAIRPYPSNEQMEIRFTQIAINFANGE